MTQLAMNLLGAHGWTQGDGDWEPCALVSVIVTLPPQDRRGLAVTTPTCPNAAFSRQCSSCRFPFRDRPMQLPHGQRPWNTATSSTTTTYIQ